MSKEEQFYYPYRRASVAATILVLYPSESQCTVLLGKRESTSEAFPNTLCLPGGFLKAEEENIRQAGVRELEEETGLVINHEDLVLINEWSNPDEDPRFHVVNVGFYTIINNIEASVVEAKDDLVSLHWCGINAVVDNGVELAFNHNDIVREGFRKWQNNMLFKKLLENSSQSDGKIFNNYLDMLTRTSEGEPKNE